MHASTPELGASSLCTAGRPRKPDIGAVKPELGQQRAESALAALQGPKGGDKLILRELLSQIGLEKTAQRPKRAVQFGTRISAQANKRDFGSNRAANAVNAGSIKLSQGLPQARGPDGPAEKEC